MKNSIYVVLLPYLLLIISCNSKPTVVEPVKSDPNKTISTEAENQTSHKVTIEEVLQTKKYTYLNVTEENIPPFWIAISKAEVVKGEKCIFTGGLKMRGFKSTDLNRIFDEVILVSNISRLNPNNESIIKESLSKGESSKEDIKPEKIIPIKGAINISEILSNPKKYEGKTITVTGRCTKINHQIMGRNWIHLEDGSNDHKELTITTQDILEVGGVGIFEGKISLDKDFGAGYRYKLIMEEANLIR